MIDGHHRNVAWIGACTQQNFITTVSNFKGRAAFIGYADESKSYTQNFNCHKVNQFKLGHTFQLEDRYHYSRPYANSNGAIYNAINDKQHF